MIRLNELAASIALEANLSEASRKLFSLNKSFYL